MSTKRYHLTGSTKFFRDAKTYYNVPFSKVENGCLYMSNEFKLANIFIYRSDGNKIGQNRYICAYSTKYRNFRYPNGQTSNIFQD